MNNFFRPLLVTALLLNTISAQTNQQTNPDEYSQLRKIPVTSFSCANRDIGYYADTDPVSGCQVYHMCDMKGHKFSYMCPNGTLFHQQHLICAHWYQVNCTTSQELYEVNKHMFPFEKFPHVGNNRLPASNRAADFKFPVPVTKDKVPVSTVNPISTTAQFTTRITEGLRNQNLPATSQPSTAETNTRIHETLLTITNIPTVFPFFSSTSNEIQPTSEQSILLASRNPTTEFATKFPSPPVQSTISGLNQTTSALFSGLQQPSTRIPIGKLNNEKKVQSSVKFGEIGEKRFNRLPLNQNCPQCNPYFLRNGKCTPCVTIR